MEEEPVSGFHLELSGERGINERLEEEQRELEERTTGRESRTESERQDRWSDKGDGSLADDEDEDDDDIDDDDGYGRSFAFIPLVKIVTKKDEKQTEGDGDVSGVDTCGGDVLGGDVLGGDTRGGDTGGEDVRNGDVSTNWENTKQTRWSRCECCGEMMSSVVFAVVGAVMFPLLVWGGHDLLPLDVPVVMSAPSRLVYTLRCALFATFPIILGVLVHGVSRLKFSSLNPLFEGKRASRHTLVHMAYVHDSLRLFLLFFLQLAVTSTYLQHHTLKLVPLLTIIFVFGRLIYWPSVCFSSSVRVLGFSLSFLPVLALMGLNLYFISTGEGAVFNVAPPTTAPPPKARWWG
ncbi:uncharacterized protein tmem79a [Silurus meridionalis]|uniref:Transmembrane protein 79 n=1 Tax=Silurus meridionalis TaxID=175797 RepID=A0A8T0BAY7_SILME|nr:uncharacterized protein tmem79a [Silurus meridionalis]KAF7702575.1 hypothetical protein HF521_001858 [Silurus meridionalis]